MDYPYKLSVIVPCYNAERYLDLSLHCLENQWDDESLEMIFINDCSSDGTIDILRDFCSRHPVNTQLIDKNQNEGVSQARNDGLAVARGEWITFLDADDALVDGAYRGLCENFLSDNIDVLSFRTKILSEGDLRDGQLPEKVHTPQFSRDMIEWEGTGKEFFVKYLTNVCWIFLYKRQLIDKYHVQFRGLSYLEDALFNMDTILNDDVRVMRVNCQLHYWITSRQNSLSTIRNRERNVVMIDDMMKALKFMQDKKLSERDQRVAERIAWKQGDSGHVIIPLLMRSDVKSGKIRQLIKQLKTWNVNPYRGTNVKSDVFYDLLYRFPLLISILRPMSEWHDRRAYGR